MLRRWGGAEDGDHAVSGGGEIVPGKVAGTFSGAALAQGKETAEAGVSGLVGGIDEDGRAVRQVKAGADDTAEIRFFGALMGADDAGERASIGNAESRETEDGGAGEELLDVGGAAEEGEVRGGLEFGVQGSLRF